jgi:methylmalonyl-CoA mutase
MAVSGGRRCRQAYADIPALVGAASAASPSSNNRGLAYLQKTARDRQNVFAALMEAVKTHSLGQISHALYDVGGEYRRNM